MSQPCFHIHPLYTPCTPPIHTLYTYTQIGETEPFICELLTNLTVTIQDLEVHQIHMFYEAVGLMIGADSDPKRKEEYLVCGWVDVRVLREGVREGDEGEGVREGVGVGGCAKVIGT